MSFNPVLVMVAALGISVAQAQETPKMQLPVKAKFQLFLLAGQSNMAGRGDVEAVDKQVHARVFALSKDGNWVPAADPIHYDKPSAGVGPGKAFAEALADQDTNAVIGLIPAACGGSPISTWEPGAYFSDTMSHPYDDAIQRAKLAMKDGTLKAIFWHQGESDTKEALAPMYKVKLEALVARFRKDLDAPDLPVIIGQLGQFEKSPWTQYTKMVNDAQMAVAKEVPHAGFVSSDGLTSKSDNLHFDARSQREFGKRYAAAYLKVIQAP